MRAATPRVFFALVLLAAGVATVCNAALSFDGAFFFFSILDHHRLAAFHSRWINIVLQAPTLAAAGLTQNVHLLRLIFSAAYASVPALSLWISCLLCRSWRPSLFIWPAIAICIATLPGQFSFHSEGIIAVTLMWPALFALLAGGPCLAYVLSAVGSAVSHPSAAIPFNSLFAIGSFYIAYLIMRGARTPADARAADIEGAADNEVSGGRNSSFAAR
jgi:hypothetical protein